MGDESLKRGPKAAEQFGRDRPGTALKRAWAIGWLKGLFDESEEQGKQPPRSRKQCAMTSNWATGGT